MTAIQIEIGDDLAEAIRARHGDDLAAFCQAAVAQTVAPTNATEEARAIFNQALLDAARTARNRVGDELESAHAMVAVLQRQIAELRAMVERHGQDTKSAAEPAGSPDAAAHRQPEKPGRLFQGTGRKQPRNGEETPHA